MKLRIRRRRLSVAIVLALPVILLSVSCSRAVDGHPTYATQTRNSELPLVKIAQLPSLILTPAEAGAVINGPDLASILTFDKADRMPDGALSDPKCAGLFAPGDELTYRGSGYQAIYGQLSEDHEQRRVFEAVAAFGTGVQAQAFVDADVKRWKDCAGKILTVTLQEPPANWIASGPNRSDGVVVVVRRLEGGQGYACSRAVAAGSNIVADISVCRLEQPDLVETQAARIANMILARIPR